VTISIPRLKFNQLFVKHSYHHPSYCNIESLDGSCDQFACHQAPLAFCIAVSYNWHCFADRSRQCVWCAFVGGSESRLTTSPQCVAVSHSGSVDTSPSVTAAVVGSAAVCNVTLWSASDVQTWLRANDLDILADRFTSSTSHLN